MAYELQIVSEDADFTAYGGAREFANYRGPEALLHGPAETGKTLASVWKLHICACKYPGASIVLARKVLNDIYSSVWAMLRSKVLRTEPEQWPCVPYGGEIRPGQLNYRNGSTIWFAGFDRAGKVLSAEHDIIYINQAEECSLEDWETATTRTTGRAGHMPYSQTIGDANPSYPAHWMYHRDSLRMFYSKHEENPALFDQRTGEITEQGKRTLAILDALTGVRKQRLRYGKAAQAEGAIYDEWDEAAHLIYADALPGAFARYVAGIDWGYRNPGVICVFGITGDGVMYLVTQIYRTGERDDWWLERARELRGEYPIEAFACDPSEPAYIDKFRDAGLNAVPGDNAVIPGINAVKKRLAERGLFILRDSTRFQDATLRDARKPASVQDELPAYVWADKDKETPVKVDDHGVDALRYAVMYVDGGGAPATGNIVNVGLENYKTKRRSVWQR
jgi:phage terminase large subunit